MTSIAAEPADILPENEGKINPDPPETRKSDSESVENLEENDLVPDLESIKDDDSRVRTESAQSIIDECSDFEVIDESHGSESNFSDEDELQENSQSPPDDLVVTGLKFI